MKKILILIITLFFMAPVVNAGWDDNITGGGVPNSGGVACNTPSIGSCYTYCNNGWFTALYIRLVYYDGSSHRMIGNAIKVGKYRNGAVDGTWLKNVIPDIRLWHAIPTGLNPKDSSNFAGQVRNAVLGDLGTLFSMMGLNYNSVMNDIKTGKYPKHQKMGSNGVNTTGVRLVVEPLFGYATTGKCGGLSGGKNYYGTSKSIAELASQRTGNPPNIWETNVRTYSNIVKLVQSDIGYTAYGGTGDYSQWKAYRSGFGVGIFSPFDDTPVDTRCDPGTSGSSIKTCCTQQNITWTNRTNNNTTKLTRVLTDAEIDAHCTTKCNPGTSKTSIQACCKSLGITENNQTNNTAGLGGKLTRPLTATEISKYCPKKCNPDSEGVETCCERFEITPTDQSNNNDMYLTRPLTQYELENSTCNPLWCVYELETSTKDVCTQSTTGYVTNTNNEWRCVFNSTKSKYSEVKTHFDDMQSNSNDYCHIYCTETVSYQMPNPGVSTYTGRYLVVQESSIHPSIWPIQYNVKKECRTTDTKNSEAGTINVNKFITDMQANEEKIKEAWDTYRTWQTKQAACDKAPYDGTGEHSHCAKYETITNPNGTTSQKCVDWDYYSHTYYGTGYETYDGVQQSCSYKTGHCYSKPNYSYQISNALNNYNNLIRKRNEMLSQIEKCNNHSTSEVLNPTLQLTYEEPVYGDTFDLKVSTDRSYNSARYYSSGNAKDGSGSYSSSAPKSTIQIYICTTANCRNKISQQYSSSKWVLYNYTREVTFELKDDVYMYVDKYSGKSILNSSTADENDIPMNLKNLPIHLSTLPGNYDYNVKTLSYGSANKFQPYAFGGNTFAGKNYNVKTNYKCEYNVDCEKVVIKDQSHCSYYETVCPDQYAKFGCGTDFQFRPVSLNSKEEAFPGIDGNGRTPGGKWNNDAVISANLTNARNVRSYEIYNLSPMYEITLTPTLMRTIREYNRRMNSQLVQIYDGTTAATTGVAGYTSLNNTTCTAGEHCISDMIRTWNVRGCAVAGSTGGYTNCNGVDAW